MCTPVSAVGDKGGWSSLPAPKPQTPQQSSRPDSRLSPLDQAMITPTLHEVAEGQESTSRSYKRWKTSICLKLKLDKEVIQV